MPTVGATSGVAPRKIRIFLSSTLKAMRPYRDEIEIFLEPRFEIVRCERWRGMYDSLPDAIEAEIRSCELVVLVVGSRRGSRLQGLDLTVTEFEYRTARTNRIPLIPFIKKGRHVGEHGKWIKELRQRHLPPWPDFETPQQLGVQVRDAVENWVNRRVIDVQIDTSQELEQDRDLVRAFAMIGSDDPGDWLEIARIVERLLPQLHIDTRFRRPGVKDRAAAVDQLLDLLVEKDPRAIPLLHARAKLREMQDRRTMALADVQRLIKLPGGNADVGLLTDSGRLLIFFGDYDGAREALRSAEAQGSQREKLVARAYELWIDDYQGRHDQVVAESRRRLRAARELDDELFNTIEHRMGRSLLAHALVHGRDRELMEQSLKRIQHAWELELRIGDHKNPFPALWVARATDALQARDRDARWQEAVALAEAYGGDGIAHLRLQEADRALMRDERYAALVSLEAALDIWKAELYAKGVFDVAWRLGRIHGELGFQLLPDSVKFLRLAEWIGIRLKLPGLNHVRAELSRSMGRLPYERQLLLTRADAQLLELSFAPLLGNLGLTQGDKVKCPSPSIG